MNQALALKYLTYFVRAGIVILMVFYTLSFASAYAIQNTIGMAYAIGGLIGHAIVFAALIEVPKKSETQVVELPIPMPKYIYVSTKPHKPRSASGYVYVLKQVNGTHYKIGCTSKPDDRLHTFKVKLPFPVAYEILMKCEDRHKLEKQLHAKYASKRVDGEWFNLDSDDLEYLKGLASE